MTQIKGLFVLLLSTIFIFPSFGQQRKELENQVNIMFGTGQILAGGFNIEGNLAYKRLFIDYSHGVSLDSPNNLLEDGADKQQDLSFHIPWTTGFGVGYRFTNWLNLRVEPKWHKFEMYYDGDVWNEDNLITEYTTFTLGLGLYANLKPFKNQDNFLRGIMIAPNVRWWPNVSTTLSGDEFQYFNERTAQMETHQARNIGMANTPFFVNLSIGYSFGIR